MSKEKTPVPNIEPTPLIKPGVFEETIKTIIANADRDRRQIEAMLEAAIDRDKTSATASLFAAAPDMLLELERTVKVIENLYVDGVPEPIRLIAERSLMLIHKAKGEYK